MLQIDLDATISTYSNRVDRQPKALREVTDRVVGSIFFNTLLQQARSSSLKGEIGHGGRGEEIFQAQMDQILAERSGQAVSTGLSDAIVRRLDHQFRAMNPLDAPEGGKP